MVPWLHYRDLFAHPQNRNFQWAVYCQFRQRTAVFEAHWKSVPQQCYYPTEEQYTDRSALSWRIQSEVDRVCLACEVVFTFLQALICVHMVILKFDVGIPTGILTSK